MRPVRLALFGAFVAVTIAAMVGCGSSDDTSEPGRLARATDVPGTWDLDVFFSSGDTTLGDYFGDPEVAEVDAVFRVDRTFTMTLRDANGSRLGEFDGTWDMPVQGDMVINYPDGAVMYTARYIQGWLFIRTGLNGEEIRLYFN